MCQASKKNLTFYSGIFKLSLSSDSTLVCFLPEIKSTFSTNKIFRTLKKNASNSSIKDSNCYLSMPSYLVNGNTKANLLKTSAIEENKQSRQSHPFLMVSISWACILKKSQVDLLQG